MGRYLSNASLGQELQKYKEKRICHCFVFQVAELRHQANKVNFPLRPLTQMLHLPPYSPFLNPIEFCWSKLKAGVAREILTKDDTLTPRIISSAQSVTASDCEGWIKHSVSFFPRCPSWNKEKLASNCMELQGNARVDRHENYMTYDGTALQLLMYQLQGSYNIQTSSE